MKVVKFHWTLLCILAFAFCSCMQTSVDMNSYRKWFADAENGFIAFKRISNLEFTAQYRPVSLMMLNELEENRAYSRTELDEIKTPYGESMYFMLEARTQDKNKVNRDLLISSSKDYRVFSEKLNRASFWLEDYVELILGEDTIRPSLTHYERGFELGSVQRFLIAFPVSLNETAPGEFTLLYRDEIFNTGINKFRFKPVKNTIPELPVNLKDAI